MMFLLVISVNYEICGLIFVWEIVKKFYILVNINLIVNSFSEVM